MPRLPRNELTAAQLHEIAYYDTNTGFMGWKVTRGQQKAGTQIGRLMPSGHLQVMMLKRNYFVHRLAWLYVYGKWPVGVVHHLNGNPADNRIINLRELSQECHLALPRSRAGIPPTPFVSIPEGDWWQQSESTTTQQQPKTMLSAERLRELLVYDPNIGEFLWKNPRSNRDSGTTAGYIGSYGYRIISINKRRYFAQRLAWLYIYGVWPANEIDHINGDRADNRIVNLRVATRSQNLANTGVRNNNKIGLKGVSKHHTGKWAAEICFERVRRRKYGFFTPEEAHASYRNMAYELHGEFTRFE